MADLRFAVVFSAVDHLSDTFSRIGNNFMNFGNRAQEAAEHVSEMGERLAAFGERTALTGALISEGADKLHEWSEAIGEPAQDMQKQMAGMAAMTGLAGEQLETIKRHAVEFASSHPGATAEEWVSGFTRMRDIFQDTSRAMQAQDTAALLKRLGVDGDTATRLIQIGLSNLGTAAARTGDELTRTIQVFGLAPDQANQFAMAVGRMAASGAAAHSSYSEILALSGEANRLLGGGRGATMFASMMTGLENAAAQGKASLDFSHGLVTALRDLKSQLSGTSLDKLAQLHDMGIGAQGPQMLKLLDNLDEVAARQRQIGNSSGALAAAYGTATNNMADATARLQQNWSNLGDALSSPALGIQARATNLFSDAVEALSKHVENHSKIAGIATIAVTGLGSAAYHGVQAMSAIGAMAVFAGRGMQALGYARKFLDFESMALRLMYAKDAIAGIANATGIWTAGQWALNAALSATGLTIAGVAAGAAVLAVGAYEIYEHWAGIKSFFERLWTGVKHTFGEVVDWMKSSGINMMKSLGEGILSGIEYPFEAAWNVAKKVGSLFHFHSPPDIGPLRDAVLNFRFGEALAAQLTPAPLIAPAVTMARSIAQPLMGGAVTMARSIAQPLMGGAVTMARTIAQPLSGAGGGGRSYSAPITINAPVTINGTNLDEKGLLRVLRQHARELADIVERGGERSRRLAFSP
jgi:hypothetical protein